MKRIQVEEDKGADERGLYLYPAAFGQPEARWIGFKRQQTSSGAGQPAVAGGDERQRSR